MSSGWHNAINVKECNYYIVQCLTQIKAEKKIAYLLGDYNINLLNIDKHASSQDFTDALLFLLYIKDLCNVSKRLFALLFADDSNMFLSGKNPDDLIRIMNEEMIKVVDWLQINRLSLNLNKTHFILFRRERVKISLSADLIINNIKIGMTERTKFLGVMIDQNLSFQNRIMYITNCMP